MNGLNPKGFFSGQKKPCDRSIDCKVELNADVGRTGTNLIAMNRVAFLSHFARLRDLKIGYVVG